MFPYDEAPPAPPVCFTPVKSPKKSPYKRQSELKLDMNKLGGLTIGDSSESLRRGATDRGE